MIERFGDGVAQGSAGGTGIRVYKNGLYAERTTRSSAIRCRPTDRAEGKSAGHRLGTAAHRRSSDASFRDRPRGPFVRRSRLGNQFLPVPEPYAEFARPSALHGARDSRRHLALRRQQKDQHFSAAERYATGLRNGEGFAFDSAGRLFVTQHGRDQLSQNWPRYFNARQSAELPAEEIVLLQKGADYGWPECYYDQLQNKLVLAPEYGGDGKEVGVCAGSKHRSRRFPAIGRQRSSDLCGQRVLHRLSGRRFCRFPWFVESRAGTAGRLQRGVSTARRRQGRRAFHCLRRRLCRRGQRAGPRRVPAVRARHGARRRALYFRGHARPHLARHLSRRCRCGSRARAGAEGRGRDLRRARPARGHPSRRRPHGFGVAAPARGATAEQVALGERIFHGEAADGTCAGCHGSDANGSPQGPSLVSGKWLDTDGTFAGLRHTITDGVPKPKNSSPPMPPRGGAPLTDADVTAVAAYVWAISHPNGK